MIEPLPKELASLIAAERTTTASTAVRESVRAKLAISIGSAPLGAAAATSMIKIVTILVLAIGVGTVAVIKAPSSEPITVPSGPIAHVEPRELQGTVTEAPGVLPRPPDESQSVPATRNVTPPALAPVASRLPPSAPISVAKAHTIPVLTSEAELIAAAWSALSDHDAELALTLARRDEVEHPTGALAEERAALRIVALAHLDRLPEAKASADAFRQKYPNSVHRELVAAALTGGTQ